MSILEDLDLMDLLDELPEGSDFDLDDILFEYSTPGLFTAAEKVAQEEVPEAIRESIEPLPAEETPSTVAEETVPDEAILPEQPPEQSAPVGDSDVGETEIVPAISFVPEGEEVMANDDIDKDDEHNPLLDDHFIISDILFDYGTPTDEDGVKLYNPSAKQETKPAEDDVKVYTPDASSLASPVSEQENTILFNASEWTEVPNSTQHTTESPKAPGFFAKAAAAVMGLFASKKSVPVAAAESAPETHTLSLFTGEAPMEEVLPTSITDDSVEDDAVPVISVRDDAFSPDNQEIPEAVPTVYSDTQDTAYDDSALFGDPMGISELLFEFGSPADETASEEISVIPELPKALDDSEEDMKVYAPIAVPEIVDYAESRPTETDLSGSTVIFDTVDLSKEASEIQKAAPIKVSAPSKAPGLLTKLAAAVMGLFSSKKVVKPTTPPTQASAFNEEDPFAHLADLFAEGASDELSDMDELMLELELQAEREAELEAESAAREAAERLAQEEAQMALELEAQRLAQEEADAAAAQKQQEAAEELQSLAEEELFEWIEASEKRRQTSSAAEAPIPEAVSAPLEQNFAFEIPAIEDLPSEPNIPVYDYAAVAPSAQTEAYEAPQMNISIEEDGSEAIDDLSEMSGTEGMTQETETAEEAAARKKKEEDELHYKPEESTAKTISSHIGKRFSAAFTAFAESDDDSDREEDLGPELPASKAYRFFNKFINGYRFRLRISAMLCVILGWISLGLPVLGSLKNPAVAAAMCLMLLLTVMLAGADILASGVRTLLNRRPGIHTLVSVSCIASVVDAIVIMLTKGKAGYLPFCAVSAISMCFAIYGSLLYCRSQRLNFKTLDRAIEPMTISVDYGIVEDDVSTVYRSSGHPEGYIHHSEEEDLSEAVYGIMTPILLPAIPVMTVIAALFSDGFGDFFHIMAAMFGAAASFSALIAFPLPYFLVQKELYSTKAAIAGWAGAREIGRVSNMIVTDRDLFPDETVSIKSVRIVDNVPPQLTLSYMCSVIYRSGSCLVPAFTQLAENNDCELLNVENFQCHEAGGLSGEIGPDSVLVASHSYMKLQGFRIPARKKDSENALFLAVNGHVIAYIIVDYKPIKSVRAGLESALRGNVEMIFAARDFNVTPMLITKKFKSATEHLRFPSYSQRYEITSHTDSETAACAAVVYRKSFYSYAVVVEKARYLYRSVSSAVGLSAVSSVIGILLMFIMAITGAGAAVTVSRLLIFMLLWLIPTLALTISITK